MERKGVLERARLAVSVLVACAGLLVTESRGGAHEGPLDVAPAGTPPPIIASTTVLAFNEGLDERRWSVAWMHGDQDQNPPELQFYDPAQVTVSKGALHLSAGRAIRIDPLTGHRYTYIGGRIESKVLVRYGRVAVRAKLASGPGFWPAIWLRTDSDDPYPGEIDLMNGFGDRPDGFTSGVTVWRNGTRYQQCAVINDFARRGDCKLTSSPLRLAYDLSHDFHVWAIDWRPDHITYSLDGKPYWTVTSGIPTEPMHLVLDIAVGGAQDGPPISHRTRWPGVFEVKSVTMDG